MHPYPLSQVIDAHRTEIRALVRALHPELDELAPDTTILSIAYAGLHDAHQRFDPAACLSFWAYAVHRVRGAIIDERRALQRALRRDRWLHEGAVWETEPPATPESAFEQRELEHFARSELELLPTRERTVVRGLYLEERCLDDLAAQLGGLSRSWTSRLHTRGIEMLRERLTR